MITEPLRTSTPKHWPVDATPFDVHCVERTRFPQPVSRNRWNDRLTLGLLCALGGMCLAFASLGIVIRFSH